MKGKRVTAKRKQQEYEKGLQHAAPSQDQDQDQDQDQEESDAECTDEGEDREGKDQDEGEVHAKKQKGESKLPEELTAGMSTVVLATSAIVTLYHEQVARWGHSIPHPRGLIVKSVLQYVKRNISKAKRANWTDRLANTIKDVYTPDQVPAFTRAIWEVGNKPGTKRESIGIAFRTGVDFLFANHMLLRFSNRRIMELADAFCLLLQEIQAGNGNHAIRALVVLMSEGKINQFGQATYGACFRHRDPLACPIGLLAAFLVWRWQMEDGQEHFPDFSCPESWYHIKLFMRQSDKKPTEALTYQSHQHHVKKFYERVGIKTNKFTHAPRRSAAQHQELRGVSEFQIRRAGHWNSGDAMANCYLTSLPYEFMRASAGFDPHFPSTYYIPRATVSPSANLRSMVWPELDHWLAASRSPQRTSGGYTIASNDMATSAVLELLEWLRDVFLQDAVFIIQQFPQHPMFAHPLFTSPDWVDFAGKVQAAGALPSPPRPPRLQASKLTQCDTRSKQRRA